MLTKPSTLSGSAVLISGASGLLGSALVPFLGSCGYRVHCLVRRPAQTDQEIEWDPAAGQVDVDRLEGYFAVIHLSGENVAAIRWTRAKKQRIRNSRLGSTNFICKTLAGLRHPPKVLLSASAIGFYGHRPDEILTEESPPGRGFFPDLCREWEAAAAPAERRGIRVVWLRTGLVLSPKGGVLKTMLPAFKLGLGGPLGSGAQSMSWIALDDVLGSIRMLIENELVRGPVNLVSPQPVTNREFARVLGRVLHRPAFLRTPAWVLKRLLGEMAEALLLSSARAEPRRLLQCGYEFRLPALEGALRHILGRP